MTEAKRNSSFGGKIAEFTSDSSPWWPAKRSAPEGAPNVIVMLIDDLGFSDLGPFGSEIETPNIDALAQDGWVFTNYRTAALCSPARAALLTGVNPHRAGFGFVAHADPGFPGFTCEIPSNVPTLAESLRDGGYATFMVGKWHLTLESQLHDGADKSSWPLQRGFDRYFGSMDGFTSLHHPHRLVRDNSPVDIQEFPDGYFLTDELTSEAIRMVAELRANDQTKPFFLYYAHTSVHGPIHAKAEDIANQRGRYEAGWNSIRQDRFRRQKELGVIPPDALLYEDQQVPEWESLSDEEKLLFARHMEAYAAAVEEIDDSVGHLTSYLDSIGELDNTIIIVTSDNGGSAEGGTSGTRSYFAQFAITAKLPEGWVTDVPLSPDDIGGPRVYNQYPEGWARVSNTPYRSYKSSMYEGGIHAPLVVSWPKQSSVGRRLRDQFMFVSDLAPTILDLVGIEPLRDRGGEPAAAMDGRSFASVLADEETPGRQSQMFEIVGRRAMIDHEWKAVSPKPPRKEDGGSGGVWELYNLASDPTETRDLANEFPSLTRELAEQWREEAWRNSVFPLDDDGALRNNRPDSELALSQPVTLTPFQVPLERFRSMRLTVLRSFRVDIELAVLESAHGVIVAHGDQGGGYLVGFEEGRPLITYNAYGAMHRAAAGEPLAQARHVLSLQVNEQPGLRCDMVLVVDGEELLRLRNLPMLLGMAPFTGISVGYDYGSPVDWDLYEKYRSNPFSGGELLNVRYVPGQVSSADPTVIHNIDQAVRTLSD